MIMYDHIYGMMIMAFIHIISNCIFSYMPYIYAPYIVI